MGAQLLEQDVVAWDSGEVILFGVFCLGILTAACLGFSCWCCCCGPSPKDKRVPRAVALRWASAVTRAKANLLGLRELQEQAVATAAIHTT